jgi:nucleotide-binding universal stress UspA family protein
MTMSTLKALIAVKADLASSIAIRYACQLAKLTGLGLQTLYVVKPDEQGHTPGTGWVRETWEDAMVLKGRDSISQLIQAEKMACPGLGNPKMVAGKRDMEILHELQVSDYDLFTEGILHAFEPANFLKKIHSRLYRNLPCPVLMVKNLASLDKGILALGEENDMPSCVSVYLNLFEGVAVDLDLICCRFQDTRGAVGRDATSRLETGLCVAEKMLAEKGRTPRVSRIVQGVSESLDRSLRDYGLVVVSLARENIEKSPILDLLSRNPSPVLIGWR